MKTKILDALKTKFTGVQDGVLDRIAAKLAKTVTKEEDVATAIEGVTLQQVIESYTDSRVTEATSAAVVNYEKKHGIKDGKPESKPAEKKDEKKDETPDDVPAYVKTILESNKQLLERIEKMENGKAFDTRQTQLAKTIELAPESIKTRFTKDFGRMNFKDDAEFDGWLEDVKTDVTQIVTDLSAVGAVIKKPAGNQSPSTEKVSAEVQARLDEAKAVTATPAITGMPKK